MRKRIACRAIKKKICLDFDGVIYPNLKYKSVGHVVGDPVLGALDAVKKLSVDYIVLVHSSRCSEKSGFDAIQSWLSEHGFLDYCQLVEHKPNARIFVDDRAVCFNGDWADTIEKIRGFKQWQVNEKTRNKLTRRKFKKRR